MSARATRAAFGSFWLSNLVVVVLPEPMGPSTRIRKGQIIYMNIRAGAPSKPPVRAVWYFVLDGRTHDRRSCKIGQGPRGAVAGAACTAWRCKNPSNLYYFSHHLSHRAIGSRAIARTTEAIFLRRESERAMPGETQ